MSSIDEISSKGWNINTGNKVKNSAKESGAKNTFSAILKQMRTGGGSSGGGSSDSDSDDKTTTVTQVMSDGSVFITVYKGDKIISQTKSHAAKPTENPTVLSTRTDTSGSHKLGTNKSGADQSGTDQSGVDQSDSAAGALAGSSAAEALAGGSAASLMLNMLTQK